MCRMFKHALCLQFKEISYAYEVLSDESKRRIYDQVGLDGMKEGGDSSGHPFERYAVVHLNHY